MAIINCPECGKEVSDKAKVCIHCGAPLSNGNIMIKCSRFNPAQSFYGIKVTDLSTRQVLIELAQGASGSFNISKDTEVKITSLAAKSTEGVLKYDGNHCYAVSGKPSFPCPKLVLSEVTNIDSE